MKNVIIDNVWKFNGRKVVILCLWCERPILLDGDYFLIMVPKFIVRTLFWCKKYINKIKHKIMKTEPQYNSDFLKEMETVHGNLEEELPKETKEEPKNLDNDQR